MQQWQSHVAEFGPGSDELQALHAKLQEATAAAATGGAAGEDGEGAHGGLPAGAVRSRSTASMPGVPISITGGTRARRTTPTGRLPAVSEGGTLPRLTLPQQGRTILQGVWLQLRMRAMFPGWTHFVRSASLTLELLPRCG